MLRNGVRAVGGVFFSVLIVTACTVNSDDDDDDDRDGGPRVDASVADAREASTAADAADAGPDPAVCAQKTSLQTCIECCGYTPAVTKPAEDAYNSCACQNGCATACGTFCTDPNAAPTTECETCLDSAATENACIDKFLEACDANPACAAELQCEEAADCESKP